MLLSLILTRSFSDKNIQIGMHYIHALLLQKLSFAFSVPIIIPGGCKECLWGSYSHLHRGAATRIRRHLVCGLISQRHGR